MKKNKKRNSEPFHPVFDNFHLYINYSLLTRGKLNCLSYSAKPPAVLASRKQVQKLSTTVFQRREKLEEVSSYHYLDKSCTFVGKYTISTRFLSVFEVFSSCVVNVLILQHAH